MLVNLVFLQVFPVEMAACVEMSGLVAVQRFRNAFVYVAWGLLNVSLRRVNVRNHQRMRPCFQQTATETLPGSG